MRRVPGIMLALAFVLPAAIPVSAQPPAASSLVLTKEERTALATLQAALAARDYAAAGSALSAAQATVHSEEGRYLLTNLQFQYARETNNLPLQTSTLDALIANGRTSQAELGQLYALRGTLAVFAGERQPAEKAFTRALELAPSADTALALAQVKYTLGKSAEAAQLIDRAIAMRVAAGQPVPQSIYRRGIEMAVSSSLRPQAVRLARDLAATYPTPENWRDAVLLYRDLDKPDAAALADAVRLQRAAKAMAGERDYLDAAQSFTAAGLPGEAKAVLGEGVAAGMVDPLKPTYKDAIAAAARGAVADRARLSALRAGATGGGAAAVEAGDHLMSFGDYAAAASAYSAALTAGTTDTDLVNLHLGAALALAGRRPEAEAAFRSVGGARADLATLWLAWLGRRA